MNQDYALIIGISDYKELRDLGGPINDANNFEEWIHSSEGGDIPDNNYHVITSETDPYKPLQDDIDTKLADIYEKARTNGGRRFYFFFAGHGLGASWNENGLCLPKWSRLFRNYALSSSAYLKLVVESGVFKEVFFFLDCCRDRTISINPMNPLINLVRPGHGVAECSSFVAYAASFDNAALEAAIPDQNTLEIQGYFTSALLQGLQGAAIDRLTKQITTDSLKNYLLRRVKELSDDKQKASFEDAFAEKGIIRQMENGLLIPLRLVFNTPGTIELVGPDLEVIKTATSSEWPEEMLLDKGFYGVTNMDIAHSVNIRIDIIYDEDNSIQPVTIEI